MIKFLIGGSPCTHWSIAQSKNREVEARGEGWELFKNFLIAKERFKPDYFLYENNKSAAAAIKEQISRELGVPLQYINSALVSAQNRQRFYAHNFGEVPQPEDKGIVLQDILENGQSWTEKSYCLTTRCNGAIPSDTLKKHRHKMIAEAVDYQPHNESDIILTDNSMRLRRRDRKRSTIQGTHVTLPSGITQTVSPSHVPMTFEAVAPKEKSECLRATYYKSGTRNFEKKITDGMGYMGVPVRIGTVENNGKHPQHDSRQYRVYAPNGKSVTLAGEAGGMRAKTGLYAVPSSQEAAAKIVYKVEAGLIEIKGSLYPIKLPDGYYIIRKLTVTECCRLQTLPDDYCRAVSKTQAYRGLGNGWTAEVIIHLLSHALRGVPKSEKIIVLSMFDGIGTGRYCFDRLGYDNITYYAYETDKYAIEVAMSNYPDIKQCGDAFDVREPDWFLRKRHRRAVKRVVSS